MINCPHWSDCGTIAGGCCALKLFGGRPSHGVCRTACTHPDRGPMPAPPAPRPDIPLAGDIIEALAKRLGADRLAKWWEKRTGIPCGCAERKERINRAIARLLRLKVR
jgi:hypothetical protein